MRRLVCAFVVRKPPKTGFLASRPKWNIPANILPLHSQVTTPEGGQNFFFLKVVMLHNKLKGMKCRTACKQMFGPYTHPGPPGWGQNFFSEQGCFAYQTKGKKCRKFDHIHTFDLWGWVNRSDIEIVQISIFFL